MAAGTLAKRGAALAAPLVVFALGAGIGMLGAPTSVSSPSSGILAQGCYVPPQTPGLYNPPDYSNCGTGPFIKPQGWPAPKPKDATQR